VTARHRHQTDHGQATVELALGMPVLALVVLAVLQVGVVARNRLAVELAAREGARAAASSPSVGAARSAAERAISLRPIDLAVVDDGHTVTVTVRYVDHTEAPIVGAAMPDVVLQATVSMAVEPP
jgi:hypothetical protein